MEEERKKILNDNLRPMLFKFSYPPIIALFFGALYNMVDTIFVGQKVGPAAIAGLTIVLPIMIVMWAIGFMVGNGAGSIISRNLGAGNKSLAVKTGANAIALNLFLSLLAMVPCYIFLEKLLRLFGASEEVLPYAKDYSAIILIGFILYSFDAFARVAIRAEGKPRASMYPIILGAVLNIVLDYFFVFPLNMGVRGAAIATIISQVVTAVFILIYFRRGNSIFKFKVTDFKPDFKIMLDIMKIGTPSFLMATIDSLMILLFNRAVIKYGNDDYIAIVGIGIRMIDLLLMPVIGLTQGFSTVVGFNYGAKLYTRVKKILGETIIWNTVFTTAVFLILMIFPRQLLGIFSSNEEFINIGVTPLRILIVFFPFLGFQFVGGTFFQSIGKAMPATVITISRQVIFLIPAILVFPLFWGLTGIWATWPFSDFMDVIVCAGFIIAELKVINRLIREDGVEGGIKRA
jgi:putative MATE family efflux protein